MDAYQQVFAHYADWPWAKVVKQASRYAKAIEEFAPAAIEEMRGIADGAGVTFGDVLALNVRSEVMFASAGQGGGRLPGGPGQRVLVVRRAARGIAERAHADRPELDGCCTPGTRCCCWTCGGTTGPTT